MIETRQLSRRFGRRAAIDGVDFVIDGPGLVGLVGPNGAGKSTTLRVLAGLLAPTGGSARVCGHDVAEAPREVAARVGWAPEEPALNPQLTVREQLDAAAALRRADRRRVDALIERLELGALERRLTAALSRGERRRVGLAQALVGDPPVLLLDEPGAGLDPLGLRELRAFLREVSAERIVLLSTHDLDEVERLGDRALLMRDGRLLGDGVLSALADRAGLRPWLEVRLADERDVAPVLAALPGAAGVRREGRAFRVDAAPGSDPDALAAAAARAAAAAGWPLLALVPARPSLEQVYGALVAGEGR